MTEFNLSEKIERLREKVEKWRDHFYHEVDGSEVEADEMMDELLDGINEIQKLAGSELVDNSPPLGYKEDTPERVRTESLSNSGESPVSGISKGCVFVEHIQSHLKDDEEVICTICKKTHKEICKSCQDKNGTCICGCDKQQHYLHEGNCSQCYINGKKCKKFEVKK